MNEPNTELASNRRATHDYEILETFEAGLALQGTEIKSIRNHGATLNESYVRVIKGEVWLIGCHVAPYRFGNVHNHVETRDRKLLLHKREINRLKTATQEKGLTIIPLSLYLKKGRVKIRIGLAKGKKTMDKRADLKEKDAKRQMQQVMKNFNT
ncbi:MAG: SsrA-binding protein SmpB [Parachlamydiaceae bacterium]|nr:SsrA-binding protein SmpB [Parachlamydiaceae bacterium]